MVVRVHATLCMSGGVGCDFRVVDTMQCITTLHTTHSQLTYIHAHSVRTQNSIAPYSSLYFTTFMYLRICSISFSLHNSSVLPFILYHQHDARCTLHVAHVFHFFFVFQSSSTSSPPLLRSTALNWRIYYEFDIIYLWMLVLWCFQSDY